MEQNERCIYNRIVLTFAENSSVFVVVDAVVLDSVRTLRDVVFITSALHIVEVNGADPNTVGGGPGDPNGIWMAAVI